MGCGCKGNNPTPPPQPAQASTQGTQGTQPQSNPARSLQESVKKTITKYYRVNKTGQ